MRALRAAREVAHVPAPEVHGDVVIHDYAEGSHYERNGFGHAADSATLSAFGAPMNWMFSKGTITVKS